MAEDDIQWKSVLSSRVSNVGYNAETQTLYIEWAKSGKISAYSGVPPDEADRCSKAWSVGAFLNDEIIGRYPHAYV